MLLVTCRTRLPNVHETFLLNRIKVIACFGGGYLNCGRFIAGELHAFKDSYFSPRHCCRPADPPVIAAPVFGVVPAATQDESIVAKTYGNWGFDTASMDTSIKPGDDFFDYANGTAIRNMVLPGDQPGYGSFNALYDLSELRLKALVTGLAAKKRQVRQT